MNLTFSHELVHEALDFLAEERIEDREVTPADVEAHWARWGLDAEEMFATMRERMLARVDQDPMRLLTFDGMTEIALEMWAEGLCIGLYLAGHRPEAPE